MLTSCSVKKWIYKITFPNGKIYVGMDLTGTFRYFGSWPFVLVLADFTEDEQSDFTLRREILWQSESASDAQVRKKEVEYIRDLKSNDLAIGYNRWPRRKSSSDEEPGS
jgi:hypothetical protein